MNNTIKQIAFLFAIALFLTTTSCLNTDVDTEARTPEMEEAELNEALMKLEAEGYDIDTTDLGVFYIVDEEGTGPFPAAGDTCFMEYTGFFLNGMVFDTSHDHFTDGIWQFNYLENSLIPGFNDGISLLNKGAVLDIIIPSSLAYGTGADGIPPYTPLLFALKMHDLKPVLTP